MNEQNFKDEKYTFWSLIKKYKIIIPIIQRDYAQGREDREVKAIRKKLIQDIKKALNGEKEIDFDFIYGSVNEEGELSLLDGQQRMTTLFLLYWYFAKKEKKMDENIKEVLKRFSYKNRVSSKDFLINLIEQEIDIKEHTELSAIIRNKTWYFSEWDNDPTIKSMLKMLDDINLNLYNENAFDMLTDEEKNPIKFYFIELKKFNLTDELYIKMNSRGKKLTKFEIVKSKIIEVLKKYEFTELKETFEKNIDSAWTDLFWDYRDKDYLIDDVFVRYIYFITEMIYAIKIDKTTSKDKNQQSPFIYGKDELVLDLDLIEETYKDVQNVKLLINILNLWKNKEEIDRDFTKTFCAKYEQGKVCLFSEKINLFEKCIYGDGFDITNKIILFAFILKKMNDKQITENTIDFIRIVRNILQTIRWFDVPNETYSPNVRYFEIKEYFEIFNQLIKESDVYYSLANIEVEKFENQINSEKEKARLIVQNREKYKEIINRCEDIEATKGIITNFINLIKNNPDKMEDFIRIFEDEKNTINVYRAMLLFEDYGIEVGNNPDKYFYGDGKDFYNIISYSNSKYEPTNIQSTLEKFYDAFMLEVGEKIDDRIESIIQKKLNSKFNKMDWQYYLIKYPEIWVYKECDKNGQVIGYKPEEKYIYTFKKKENKKDSFEICCFGKRRLNSWHISPYYKVIYNNNNMNFKDCYSKDEDYGKIMLKNGVSFEIEENGFKVWIVEDKVSWAIEKLRQKYGCNYNEDGSILVDFDEHVDFVQQERDMVVAFSEI